MCIALIILVVIIIAVSLIKKYYSVKNITLKKNDGLDKAKRNLFGMDSTYKNTGEEDPGAICTKFNHKQNSRSHRL